jgi:hypothetical protein
MMRTFVVMLCTGLIFISGLQAQEFGFGADDSQPGSEADASTVRGSPLAADAGASLPAVSVKIGGEIAVELSPFFNDFQEKDDAQRDDVQPNSLLPISGKIKFNVSGGNIEAYAALNLTADAIGELWNSSEKLQDPTYTPLFVDEAYLRAFLGPVSIEAGLRKLTWGKADSLGPLDVTNPLDLTDLCNMTDLQAVKIARPLLRVSWNMTGFSKLDAVFIPNFAGHRFAREGRWTPSQYTAMAGDLESSIYERLSIFIPPEYSALFETMYPTIYSQIAAGLPDASPPNTGGFDHFQAGLRFTTSVGPADIGLQYFYGNLFRPDFLAVSVDEFINDLLFGNFAFLSNPTLDNISSLYFGNPDLFAPQIKYNRYHQIGADYAQVLFGFNVRSELALHLTSDLKGNDGLVRNPFIGWSLGFDRDIFLGINLNVQCNETIRLMDSKVGGDPALDCEAGTDAFFTRFTFRLSKKLLRDELDNSLTVIWDLEDLDFYIIPSIVWSVSNFSAEISAGIFLGKDTGELGQYGENSFLKLALKYTF